MLDLWRYRPAYRFAADISGSVHDCVGIKPNGSKAVSWIISECNSNKQSYHLKGPQRCAFFDVLNDAQKAAE